MLRRRTRPIFRNSPRRIPELRHLVLALLLVLALPAQAEAPAPMRGDGMVLVSIFLRPDEAATGPQLAARLMQEGLLKAVPTDSLRIESWYAMPGLGQFVTLRLPPAALHRDSGESEPEALRIARR